MTCKDCIHYKACKNLIRLCNHLVTGCMQLDEYSPCTTYENKSKYIELPCKVGDEVYVIKNNKIYIKDIVYYNKIHSRIPEQNAEYWHCVDKNRILINVITFNPEDIGKTVFLTKEEAEQKLKELEEND